MGCEKYGWTKVDRPRIVKWDINKGMILLLEVWAEVVSDKQIVRFINFRIVNSWYDVQLDRSILFFNLIIQVNWIKQINWFSCYKVEFIQKSTFELNCIEFVWLNKSNKKILK